MNKLMFYNFITHQYKVEQTVVLSVPRLQLQHDWQNLDAAWQYRNKN